MNPGQQIIEIPKIPPQGKLKQEHQTDLETSHFVNLFDSCLVKVNNRDFLLEYIRENTIGGVTSEVVEDWLKGKIPKQGVCNDVVSVLENFRPNKLHIVKKKFLPDPKVEAIETPVLKRSKRPSFTKKRNQPSAIEGWDEELKAKIKRQIELERQRTEIAKNIKRNQIVQGIGKQLKVKKDF